jgi:ABC-type uncharacterized transport system fused permease/ATPase subunit
MVPLSCVNSLLKYATSEVALGMRQRLTHHLLQQYLQASGRSRYHDQQHRRFVNILMSSITYRQK